MFAALERYIPLFENYLNAHDKHAFLNALQDPNDTTLLDILETPISSLTSFREQLNKLNLHYSLRQEIERYKIYRHAQEAKELGKDELSSELNAQYGARTYEYSKPAVLNTQESKEGEHDAKESQLELPHSLEKYLEEKRKASPQWIRQINDYGFSKVPHETLLALPLADKEYVLQKFTTIFHFDPEFISKFLILFQQQKKKTNPAYLLTGEILSFLTKEQLFTLQQRHHSITNNENYIQVWFNQNYAQRIREHVQGSKYFTKQQHDNKRKAFQAIIAQLELYKTAPVIKGYTNKLKSEVLVLDTIVNDPHIQRLIDYLETSQVVLQLSNIKQECFKLFRNRSNSQYIEPKMRYRFDVDKTHPNQFIEDYIELLFKNSDGHSHVATLSKYFMESYLRKLNAKVRLYKGELVENTSDYFTQQELQVMKDKKEIRILDSNPKKYKINDDVVLDVDIKNVKGINIKVYELNLQKHLLGETANYSIDDEIPLSFLLPTAHQRYEAQSTNPFQVINTKLDLSKLIPKAMGVYIVDLQGETVTSRAVIRKGTIICVGKLTEAGQEFSFFDQEGRPLTKEQGLRVWIREKVAGLTGNKAFVAYSDKSQYGTIVASIGNYAQSFQKQFEEEKYKFEVGYIYNTESFIVGQKAKIVLHGRLTMNEKTMNLELLRNTKARVTVTNNQNIKTSYPFDIEKWSDRADQAIEFPIQAYTRQINIAIQTQITLQNGKESSLTSYKDISIDLGQNSTNFLDLYLQQNAHKEYVLSLLGANGEPISNADVILSYAVAGIEEVDRKQLKTNNQGRINLGQLYIVTRLSAQVNSSSSIQRVWQIDQTESSFNYNSTIHFKLGEQLHLPINPSWKQGDVLLLRTFDKFCSQDLSGQLKYHQGRLTLPVLHHQGYYILRMLPINKSIEIVTLKNIPWEDDTLENKKVYDQDDGILYEINTNLYQTIAVKHVAFQHQRQHTKAKIALDFGTVPEEKLQNVRVHVFATNLVGAEVGEGFKVGSYNVEGTLNEHYLQIKKSAYYSNKSCSDEGAYVWNRQEKNEHLIGNNLEKPPIFLKRVLVRETNENKEDLSDEGRYQEECAMMEVDPNMRQRYRTKEEGAKSKVGGQNTLNLNSHNNFLLLSTTLANNLNANSIELDIPQGYTSLEVYVLTPKSAIKSRYSFTSDLTLLKKDLRHTGLEDSQEGTGLTMSREIDRLTAGQRRAVSRDSQYRTVGLAEIFEFASTKKVKLYSWSSHLLGWHCLDEGRKREIYDKECCHQLNTFIKFKDGDFFNKVVRNFIRNKIDKTVVDLCLLDDPSAAAYTSLNKLQSLNAFEKALLVHTLVRNKHTDVARSIVEALELEQKGVKRNYEEFKNNFDTIINAKQSEVKAVMKKKMKEMQEMQPRMMLKSMACSAPRNRMMRMRMQEREQSFDIMQRRRNVMQQKKSFTPVESTKEYTEKTYVDVKNYRLQAPTLIKPSPFWAELARSFLESQPFISESFMSLKTPLEFILASSFISSESSSNFELNSFDNKYEIVAKSPMLIYVKEVKRVEHSKKFGVLINQRFFDPNNRVAYEEDGTEYEKEVEEFIVKKCYICQTVINNTSGTPLELQVLLDIPKGTIPLRSHEYTQIINIRIEPYSSKSYERHFYIPEEGTYPIYPSNASRGSTIIAKATPLPPITVKKAWTVNKLESFEDVIRSGKKDEVINFLQSRNIFDENIFKPSEILWMLRDKEFYSKVIEVLRKRSFYNADIWKFGFLHGDMGTVREVIGLSEPTALHPTAFEYFPYYSTRTHPFANESKSTIRNVQFKETYIRFLVGSIIGLKNHSFHVSHAYFLILQDRLKEADELIRAVGEAQYKAYEIQFDYMRCFLDLSLNSVNFSLAREILKKYKEYPVESWRKLFGEVSRTIEEQDEEVEASGEAAGGEAFQTQVMQEGAHIRIIQPAHTAICVEIFQVNLELYFSEYPFYEVKNFTSLKPSKAVFLDTQSETKETTISRSQFQDLKDSIVEITEVREGLRKKVTSFWWVNPEVRVKVSEKEGSLQVFLQRKRLAGAYVKVFSDKGMNKDFYRDGYTDMTGTFRYAMSDLDGIKEFSILVMTPHGGLIQKVKPPSKLASY